MPTTYEPIATITLGTAEASIVFSSIPATYTDLKLVLTGTMTVGSTVAMRYNSDTGNNYSVTGLGGNGSSAVSARSSSQSSLYISYYNQFSTSIPNGLILNVFNYSGNTFKTCLVEGFGDKNGSGIVERIVGLWRNGDAITSITLIPQSTSFKTGTTATLYGILKA